MRKIMALLLISSMAAAAPSFAADQNIYQYTNYLYPKTIFNITLDRSVDKGVVNSSTVPDAANEVSFCKKSSAYVCMKRGPFPFAIPKDLSNSTESWTFAGGHFQVIQTDYKVSIFGRTIDAYLIKAEFAPSNTNPWFSPLQVWQLIYSPTYGLLAFSSRLRTTKISSTFWLAQPQGLGAVKPGR